VKEKRIALLRGAQSAILGELGFRHPGAIRRR